MGVRWERVRGCGCEGVDGVTGFVGGEEGDGTSLSLLRREAVEKNVRGVTVYVWEAERARRWRGTFPGSRDFFVNLGGQFMLGGLLVRQWSSREKV